MVLALAFGGVGALDNAANVIVQILQLLFRLLVRLANLLVDLFKSPG